VIDDVLVACPNPQCPSRFAGTAQAFHLSQEQMDRLADQLRVPVTLRMLKSGWTWAGILSLLLAILGVSYPAIRAKVEEMVTSQIAQKFADPRIRETFQEVAVNQASKMLKDEIQPEVNRFRNETNEKVQDFQGFLDKLRADFQKEYKTLSEEVSRLKQRNDLTILGDRAITEGNRQALDELERLEEINQDYTVKIAAESEIRRVQSFWTLMNTTQYTSITMIYQDGTEQKDGEIPTNHLISYILSNQKWQVRAVPARLLGQRNEKGVLDILLKVAREDPHLEVVKHAKESFEKITGLQIPGVFNVYGMEKGWEEHSKEINKKLIPDESQ
jgi:hypothetical protein